MTLPVSGQIRLGADVNIELGNSASAQISLGQSSVRTLYGVSSGVIRLAADGYGKSSVPPTTIKTVFIPYTGPVAQVYTIPSDFYSIVSIEAIGAGGNNQGGGMNAMGGGGGAYAKTTSITGLVANGTAYARVSAGGDSTWFSTVTMTEPTTTSQGVLAAGGVSGSSNGAGGSAASSIGDIKYSGGSAGARGGGLPGSGGGGAAGPGGKGGDGGAATGSAGGGGGSGAGSSLPGVNGVTGSGSTGGVAPTGGGNGGNGGDAGSVYGTSGSAGNIWTQTSNGATAGPGGGGGGSNNSASGGLYGGGAGARYPILTGARGLLVFTYNAII